MKSFSLHAPFLTPSPYIFINLWKFKQTWSLFLVCYRSSRHAFPPQTFVKNFFKFSCWIKNRITEDPRIGTYFFHKPLYRHFTSLATGFPLLFYSVYLSPISGFKSWFNNVYKHGPYSFGSGSIALFFSIYNVKLTYSYVITHRSLLSVYFFLSHLAAFRFQTSNRLTSNPLPPRLRTVFSFNSALL